MSQSEGSGRLPHAVLTPLVMPFTPSGTPDFDSLARQAAWVVDNGASGVWVNGSTAEFYAVREGERTEAIQVVADALRGRGVPVAGQVGAPGTRLAVRLANEAVQAGATALAAVLPYYAPFEEDECEAYVRAVAEAGGVPLYLYQVPAMSKVTLSADGILSLAADGVLAGMKDSWGNLTWLRYLVESAKRRSVELDVFMGDAALLNAGMATGAVGMITAVADVIPRHIGRAVRAVHAGDWTLATQLQTQTVEFLESLKVPQRPAGMPRIPSLKVLLAELGVIAHPLNAAPFRELDSSERAWLLSHALPLAEELEAAALAAEGAAA